ncbi:DUF2878 family protein [Arenimonas fontis]|uniref:DUF2878 domain-containing protein n=1 Tax=Arenimonas fontis TaxID=2608255 RepID=A0A5B2ZE01_9GAMM|nr:DUF2878 family protein [Arenimonas fontis]KAA2286175.1 DUF2878 domain-containing protein [Arenimonas fontis]
MSRQARAHPLPNLLGNQLVWLAAVIGAGEGLAWAGPAAAALFATWHLATVRPLWPDLRLVALALACGLALDALLVAGGWLRYATPAPALAASPLWILALWLAFALTLRHGLAFLVNRQCLALCLGAVGGPLAYLAAARGWNAVQLLPPGWLLLAIGWALAMWLLVRAATPAPPPGREATA